MLINKTENEGCLKNNNFKGGFVMTELQVKTQKGSLKKFLATFLAFCVCLTTVFVDGAFAQAAEQQNTKAGFKKSEYTLSRTDGAKVDLSKEITPDNAGTASEWTSDNAEKITVSDAGVVSLTEAGKADNSEIKAKITAKISDNTLECTVKVLASDSEKPDPNPPGGGDGDDDEDKPVVSPDAAFKASKYSLERGGSLNLGDQVSPSNATKTDWSSDDAAKISVTSAGVVTLTAAGEAYKDAFTATVAVKANGKQITCKVNVKAVPTPPGPVVKNDSVTSVTVSPKTLTAKAGETKKVTATVALASDKDTAITKKLAKTVTWKSDNDKVATVDASGNVKAVAAGTAKITATSTADSKKSDVCTVTVTEDKKDDEKPADTTVAVSGITLNAKTIYLKTGTKFTAKAAVAPANATNKKVTWTSNKKNIATVNANGVITAKKKTGKATITAKAGNRSAKITVNVVKKAKKTTSVKLSKSKVTLTVKDNFALAATLSKGATSKVKWTTSDKKVASVKDGVVTAKKKGVAVITATADGKSADCVVTVKDAKGKKAATLKVKTKKISVKVKKTKKIQVTLAKKDSVKSYVSSNKKIATVSKKGVVTGKKKGKATIIVTTKKGAVATIPVTVK